MPIPAIVTVGSLSVAQGLWASIAAGHTCWRLWFGSAIVWCLLGWLGACLSAILTQGKQAIDPILACLLGYFASSVLLFFGTVILHLDIVVSFGGCVLLLVGLAYRTRHQTPLSRLQLGAIDTATLLIAVLFTTLWSRQNLTGMVVSSTFATSTPWLDTLYHSVHVAHFAHGSGKILGTDPLIGSAPLAPYHYAAYLIPSLLVRTTGTSAYLNTVAHFAPLGTLFTGLGAYALGRVLAGSVGALFAVVVCLAVPDPTFYLLENRWLSYFFFQQIAANGAFGTALLALGWTLCVQGVIDQRRVLTLAGLTAGLFVVLFKSQLFLTYSFGLLLFASVTFPRLRLGWRVLLGALSTGLFAACLWVILPAIPRAPTYRLGTSAGPTNLHFALSNIGGSCQACVAELGARYPLFLSVAVPAFLVFTFGALLLLLFVPVVAPDASRALRPQAKWLLWIALVNFLVIAVGLELNSGHGDPFEIVHKTFIWPYFVVSLWCGCAVAGYVVAQNWWIRQLLLVVGLPLALVGLGHLVNDCSSRLQTGFVYVGSETSSHLSMPRDGYDTAEFLRTATPKNARIQLGVLDSLLFQSVAERRAYNAFPLHAKNAPESAALANAKLSTLLAAPTSEAFIAEARACQIDFFVLYPGQQPSWANVLRPVFQSGGYRVYRI